MLFDKDKPLVNEINSLIREEMCINDSVKNESYALVSLIKEKYATLFKNNRKYNEYGCCEIQADFKYAFTEDPFEGVEADVSAKCVCFKDENSYADAIKRFGYGTECQSIARNIGGGYMVMLWIGFTAVGNKVLSDLNDGVHHEMNHAFQQIKMKNSYKDFYGYGKYVNDLCNKDESFRNIANLLYLTNEAEADSIMNGMYGEVMNNYKGHPSINDAIYASNGFHKLKEMESYYGYALANPTKIKPSVKKYGYNLTEFYKKVENNMKRFKEKFGKTVMKIKDDIYGISEGHVRTCFITMNENRWNNDPLYYNIIKLN